MLRRGALLTLLLAVVLSLTALPSPAQNSNKRKLLGQVAPAYPTLARRIGLQGVVKIDALVASDGSVKATDIKGGHPVLAQAAIVAIRQWRWEVAPRESHEIVEVKFSPE